MVTEYMLSSQKKIKHTIKGDKAFTDCIQDSAQISALLKAYLVKYGYKKYIRLLITSYSNIQGGWSFVTSKESLAHVISIFNQNVICSINVNLILGV